MRTIKLSKGVETLVDDEVFETVSVFKWYARGNEKDGYYATRKWRHNGRYYTVDLHTFLTGYTLCDHISGNSLDNRRCNLRDVTKSQNAMNSKLPSDNKSGHKGVWYDKTRKSYQVYITKNKKRKCLGRLKSFQQACELRVKAEKEFFGEYRRGEN